MSGLIRGTGSAVRTTRAAVRSTASAARGIGAFDLSAATARAIAESDGARRELVLLAGTLIAMSSFVEGPGVWLIGGATALLVALGTRRAVGVRSVGPVPPEAAIAPAVAAFVAVAAVQLIPLGLLLPVAIILATGLVDAAIALESRIAARPMGFTPLDRSLLLGLSLLLGFLGFSGIAGLVPDALVQPAGGIARVAPPLASLLVLAVADAAVAFALGYRFAALRAPLPELALRTASTYGAAIAIAAGLFSAAALPRFLGPALLTLVFFLWEWLAGAEAPTRRDPRFIWQVVLLAVLGLVVVVWNLLLPR